MGMIHLDLRLQALTSLSALLIPHREAAASCCLKSPCAGSDAVSPDYPRPVLLMCIVCTTHVHLIQVLSREPLFDQIIVNLYRPGEGIKSHVDLMRFEVRACMRCPTL